MRRLMLSALFALVFAAGIASAQIGARHQASDSDAIYQYGQPIQGAKVVYIRDNTNPETCTQIIIIGSQVVAAPAHKDSCNF